MSEVKEKVCIACGMPMREQNEFAQADPSKDYCCYCAKEDGSMRTYEEQKKGMTKFYMETQGIEADKAEEMVVQLMSKLPAWQ